MTNTVALVAVGVGALANSSREVADTGPKLVRWSLYSAAGGIIGALILWLAPEGSFESVVPAMVVFASLALLLQPKIRELSGGGDRPGIYSAALFAVAVYGGYFGAGAGVIFLAATLILTSETVWACNDPEEFLSRHRQSCGCTHLRLLRTGALGGRVGDGARRVGRRLVWPARRQENPAIGTACGSSDSGIRVGSVVVGEVSPSTSRPASAS